jgi:hypothetical protein
MSLRELPIKVTTERGKLRAVLPATSIEADDAEGLMNQADLLAEAFLASIKAAIEDAALREVEAKAIGQEELERLAARYPAPPEWFDEPG